jgi:hypothetical protein
MQRHGDKQRDVDGGSAFKVPLSCTAGPGLWRDPSRPTLVRAIGRQRVLAQYRREKQHTSLRSVLFSHENLIKAF